MWKLFILLGVLGLVGCSPTLSEIPLIPPEYQGAFNLAAFTAAKESTQSVFKTDCRLVLDLSPAFSEFTLKLKETSNTRALDTWELTKYALFGVNDGLLYLKQSCEQSPSR